MLKVHLCVIFSSLNIFLFSCFASAHVDMQPSSLAILERNRFPSVQKEYVYHGSLSQNLTILEPHISTHGESWLYATFDPVVAVSFLVNAGDFDFCWSKDGSGMFSITERYQGAFDLFKGVNGSIYKLSSEGFLFDQTDWNLEVVIDKEVAIIDELHISNVFEILKQLEAEGRLKLYYYPNRPVGIPEDDIDIINKAVLWYREEFPNVRERFLQLYPHLKDRFEIALKSSNLPTVKEIEEAVEKNDGI